MITPDNTDKAGTYFRTASTNREDAAGRPSKAD